MVIPFSFLVRGCLARWSKNQERPDQGQERHSANDDTGDGPRGQTVFTVTAATAAACAELEIAEACVGLVGGGIIAVVIVITCLPVATPIAQVSSLVGARASIGSGVGVVVRPGELLGAIAERQAIIVDGADDGQRVLTGVRLVVTVLQTKRTVTER